MKLKRFLKVLGPGFITGASDDDPSGIGTYSQTGAQFGYQQLWAALFSFPFMTTMQEISGRIGMVTGRGLSAVIRERFPKVVLYAAVAILFFANTINIGADLRAMTASVQLLVPLPFYFVLFALAIVMLALQILVPYKNYAKLLKYLTLSLVAYVVTAFAVSQDWGSIAFHTFVPSFRWDEAYLLNIVAFLGTTISPYLFFWQSDEEVEEEVSRRKLRDMGEGVPKVTKGDLRRMRLDTAFGMFISNMIAFFIIVTTASTLARVGITNIETADQAAAALAPIAGSFSSLLFALGIVGTGLLAVPVLAGSASYAVAEAVGWKEGLSKRFREAKGFYLVIILATLVGLLINFTSIPPFKMLYYSAALNGVLAPPLMVIMMLISGSPAIMGQHKNSRISAVLGWGITLIMGFVAIAFILSL